MVKVGNCLDVMSTIEPESFTACVTDPPYGLEFMGKDWDKGVPGVHFWAEVLRLLKPGGMLLAFGGTRTFHRLACAIEDAGFEIRDCLCYMYGSGFPKSLDTSKAIDKAAGIEREILSEGKPVKRIIPGADQDKTGSWIKDNGRVFTPTVSKPASAAAALWEGYGTALKPAWEPIIVAMKPLSGTFAQNALRHGVAGIHVDGCRIETNGELPAGSGNRNSWRKLEGRTDFVETPGNLTSDKGRWPANVVLDELAAGLLDAQTGELASGSVPAIRNPNSVFQANAQGETGQGRRTDSGGASRFFYTSKVSPEERGDCTHPTMKPLDLMRWLLTLVTMPSGTKIVDPFAGSGTTLVAAKQLGIEALGIELNPEYAAMAEKRIASVTPSLFSDTLEQTA